MSGRSTIEHGDGSIIVRKFDYEDLVATIWVGNENAGQEADAMLTGDQVRRLIVALTETIE